MRGPKSAFGPPRPAHSIIVPATEGFEQTTGGACRGLVGDRVEKGGDALQQAFAGPYLRGRAGPPMLAELEIRFPES